MKLKINILTITAFLMFQTLQAQGQVPSVGTSVQGDFNGDGQKEFAFSVQTKIGEGNPMEDGTADEFAVNFSTDKFKSIDVGCCDIRLINEGDLNADGNDEITVFQAPMNGCTYSMTTYSFVNNTWKTLIESLLIPTGCDYLSDEEIQKRIFIENGKVYYYDVDSNDENFKLVKKSVKF